MDTAAWPLVGDIAGTSSVRHGPGRPCRMPCVLLCLSAASFSTPANGTLGKRSGAREPARGQVADANLFRRTPQTAVGGQLSYEGEPLGAPAPDFQSLLRQSRFWVRANSPCKQSLKNDHKAMIFLHTEKEPVHDYVRQALFLSIKFAVYSF